MFLNHNFGYNLIKYCLECRLGLAIPTSSHTNMKSDYEIFLISHFPLGQEVGISH